MLAHFRNYLKPTFSVGADGALEVGNVPVLSPEALLEAYRSGERRIGGGWRSVFLDYLGNRLSLYRAHGGIYAEEWRVMAAILRRFTGSVREAGACPLLVIFPTRPEDYHGTVFEEIDRRARREADALDLPWLALAEDFYDPERPGDGDRWFQEGSGGHLSDEGIAVAAEAIGAAVEGLDCAGRRAGAQADGSPRPVSSPVR
jgi:hypothetical protein